MIHDPSFPTQQQSVLALKLLQAPQLANAETAVHLLPAVERLLRNPHSPDRLGHRRTGFQPASERRQSVCVPRFLHVQLLAQRLLKAGNISLKISYKQRGEKRLKQRNIHTTLANRSCQSQ